MDSGESISSEELKATGTVARSREPVGDVAYDVTDGQQP